LASKLGSDKFSCKQNLVMRIFMNKEEILSKSVKENKGKDLVDLEAAIKADMLDLLSVH